MCKSRAPRLLQQINCMVHGDIQRQALSREEVATLSCNLSLALSKLATAGLNDSSRHSRLAHGITQPAPGNHVRGVAERRSYRSQPGHFFAMATNQLILAVGRLARFAQLVPASDPPLPATRPCQRIQSKRETAPDSHILPSVVGRKQSARRSGSRNSPAGKPALPGQTDSSRFSAVRPGVIA